MTPAAAKASQSFAGMPVQSSLMRTPGGRAILPPLESLDGNRGLYHFTDADLHAIYRETVRRRRWWRFWHYLRLGVIAGFLLWTFWLMPAAAMRAWPFN